MIYLYWSAGAPRRARRAHGLLQARRRHPRRGDPLRAADPRCPATPPHRASSARRSWWRTPPAGESSVFDNGLPLAPTDWITDGRLANAAADPTLGRADRPARDPGHRQPDHDGARGRTLAGGDDRLHRARPAAHLPVVHPRGGPADAAAHRADPGRRLPGRERRGRGRGEQLPLQREPGRPAAAGSPRSAPPSRPCRASGATTSPARSCRRSGCPTSTCRRSARPARACSRFGS